MKNAFFASAVVALVSNTAISGELTLGELVYPAEEDQLQLSSEVRSRRQPSAESSAESRIRGLESRVEQLQLEVSSNQGQISELRSFVSSIHGPTQPPTEEGYAVYDYTGDFVGRTEDGNEVRITLDQYPGLYFMMPAFEENLLSWSRGSAWQAVFFPDSIDCSTQPYLLSSARQAAYASVTLLNPTPVFNSPEGVILKKDGYSSIYFVSDPNNDAEAVSVAIAGSSFIGSGGTCSENTIAQAVLILGEDPIAVPASEVTIEIAYPLQVIYD